MTTTMKINAAKKTIELTKTFATKAARYGSDEYKQLQEARRDYPNYKVVTVERSTKKNTYKGLTYDYMEKYIVAHDETGEIMAEYMEYRAMTEEAMELGAESSTYGEIREWFIEQFPEIKEFHENREKKLEDAKAARLAKREADKKAKLAEKIAALTKSAA